MILLNLRHKLIVEMRIFATFFVLDTIVIDNDRFLLISNEY